VLTDNLGALLLDQLLGQLHLQLPARSLIMCAIMLLGRTMYRKADCHYVHR